MKKVIFEEPKDTIKISEVKDTDYLGAELQKTKGMLVGNSDRQSFVVNFVTKDLTLMPDFYKLEDFTSVYKFDSLPELIEWLCQSDE